MTRLRRLHNQKQKAAQLKEYFWQKACEFDSVNVDTTVRLAFVAFSANNPYAVKYGRMVSLFYKKYDQLMSLPVYPKFN